MTSRNPARAGTALVLTLAATGTLIATAPAAAPAAGRPTPACVHLVRHVPPANGADGRTVVRNRCATGRYVKVTYDGPQTRVGACLRPGRAHTFRLPWKYPNYRGVTVKSISETRKTCRP
jgi:hypothetical protein